MQDYLEEKQDNMIKKVLVIAYYFPPMGLSGVQRTLKFVKYLPKFGWEPVVITTNAPAYYAFDDSLLEELGDETKIYRTDEDISKYLKKNKQKDRETIKYPSRFSQKIKRIISQFIFQPDSRITWKKHALKAGKKALEENEIDAIYATAPPFTDFLVAKELSEEYNIPYLIDYRDLWLDNAFYVYPTPFHKNYSAKLENEVLKKCSKALVITRYMKEQLIKRYQIVSHEDVSILPHGYDPEDFKGVEKDIYPGSGKFVLTHSGLFPDDLTPKYFLKAFRAFLKENPEAKENTELRFIGLMRYEHQKLVFKYKLEKNIVMYGYLPHDEVIKHLLSSDVLWFMITNNIATPSRMYEYIGAKKPIIACTPEGSIKETALKTGAAETCQPKNETEIKAAIEKYYKLWKKNSLPKPKNDYIKNFDREKLTESLAKELELLT